jgi:hypothetical protein
VEGGYARPDLPRGGRLRSPGSAAWRAATLARICRVEGGYARLDLPLAALMPRVGRSSEPVAVGLSDNPGRVTPPAMT